LNKFKFIGSDPIRPDSLDSANSAEFTQFRLGSNSDLTQSDSEDSVQGPFGV